MSENKGIRIVIKIVLTLVILTITGAIRKSGGGWIFPVIGGVGVIAVWKWSPEGE